MNDQQQLRCRRKRPHGTASVLDWGAQQATLHQLMIYPDVPPHAAVRAMANASHQDKEHVRGASTSVHQTVWTATKPEPKRIDSEDSHHDKCEICINSQQKCSLPCLGEVTKTQECATPCPGFGYEEKAREESNRLQSLRTAHAVHRARHALARKCAPQDCFVFDCCSAASALVPLAMDMNDGRDDEFRGPSEPLIASKTGIAVLVHASAEPLIL